MSDEPEDDVVAVADAAPDPDGATTSDEVEGGWVVRVSIQAMEAETKMFGPYSTEAEAEEVAEGIFGGTILVNFFLTPKAIEGVFVEPVELPKEEAN